MWWKVGQEAAEQQSIALRGHTDSVSLVANAFPAALASILIIST